MKIALLHRKLGRSTGGIQAWMYHVASTLLAQGHTPRAIVGPRPHTPPPDAMPPGVPVTWLDIPDSDRVPGPAFQGYYLVDALTRGLRHVSGDVDAYWCRSYPIAWAASRVAQGRPVVFVTAGPESDFWRLVTRPRSLKDRVGLVYRLQVHNWLEGKTMARVSSIVFLSGARRDETLAIHGERFRSKSHVIPPGVDLDRFSPPGPRRSWDGCLRTVSVCRLSVEKNLGCLIHAVRLLKDADVSVQSMIVGDGEMYFELAGLIEELELTDRVFLVGRQSAVERFYRDADLFVLPSTYEGFGSAYLEAFASGLGCVAIRRRVPAYKVAADEIIEHGRTGLLIDENDPRLLADALKYAHDHPDEMREWGRAARETAVRRYPWDRCIEDLLTLTRSFDRRRRVACSPAAAAHTPH